MFERPCVEETIPLQPGDLYLFFTDGISEAMNAHDDCSASRGSAGWSRRTPHLPSEELRERVLREIAAFVGDAPQHDDMTMILLKVDELPACRATIDAELAELAEYDDRGPRGPAVAALNVVTDLVVIFRTHSDIEAQIVRGLLEAHGVHVGRLVRRPALDLSAVGRRPQRGAHRGARRARPRRRSASSRATAPS